MKRNLAKNVNQANKKINAQMTSDCAKESDIGSNLLKDNVTLENISDLAKRIADQQEYDADQLVVCEIAELNERLELHRNDDIDDKPVFVICHNSVLGVFCIVNLSGKAVCLYKDFLDSQISEDLKEIVKLHFGNNVIFKVHKEKGNEKDTKDQDVLCLKTLETMMVHLKPDKKKEFIENFDNNKKSFFQWITNSAASLRNELFSLVKESYYKTVVSDINQLSKDTEFKNAINKFIDNMPLLDDLDNFKAYQILLKEFVEMEENGVSADISKIEELERAREKAFGKIKSLKIDLSQDENNVMQLDIVNKYSTQMKKFTKIFEPLMKSKVDKQLYETLKEISLKLGINYDKLKVFFESKEEKKYEEHATFGIIGIDEIISSLPSYKSQDIDHANENRTFDQLLSEITLEKSNSVNVKQLKEAYNKVKERYKLWNSKEASQINQWAVTKKYQLADSEVYEALAVMDRANELATGGQKLRDTQILSILAFLLQRDRGQLAQIQTGEGKTTIVSVLAAIKALEGKQVDVVTSNPILASDGIKNRKLFYGLLGLTAATNNVDENYKSGARKCYRANIVYGALSNFQFDYLKDSFLGLKTRANRSFDIIILDEVDSMIIDNASHIAKLSGSLPGMETLKYVYIKIWQLLHKAEDIITQEMQEQLKLKAQELDELPDEDEADLLYEQFVNELQSSVPKKIKDYIKSRNPTKIDVIPSHIQQYADKSLDKWIDNAIDAKYSHNEDEQYVIKRIKNGEEVIQPVDYANTGITLKNTIWQYGLHQFLQLRHNLYLTAESLTSCFISNLGYINNYENRILGLTGTLGSKAEQDLLSSIYNLAYAKIPTYKEKRFEEIDGEIVDDDEFNDAVAHDAISKVDEGRATLVICETIKTAKAIKELLLREDIEIRTFLDEENADVTDKEVYPGEVVIATNIAGRGTDFKTSKELEDNRGLHVCVTFLPCNKRVEDQAFGRTARQGNYGTAKLIVKKSETERLGIDEDCSFEELKRKRDQREIDRIEQIKRIKVPELEFQDKLFGLFSALYRNLQIQHEGKEEYRYALDDLKEFWAFWLEKQNYKGSELANKSLEEEFKKFKYEARETIEGKIQFNPYYSILQAEHFIAIDEQLDRAENSLHHAIAISENPEILHTAYMKLFEVAIEKGGVFLDRYREAVGNVFFISAIKSDREYKQNAKKYLVQAQKAFKKELNYINDLFADKEFANILISSDDEQVSENSEDTTSDQSQTNENIFIKHIVSRQQLLILSISHANELIKQIDDYKDGITIGARVPDYFSKLKPKSENEKKLKSLITNLELGEFAGTGGNIFYALRKIHDVCPEIIMGARIQIGGGLSVIAMGMCYPPAMLVTTPIGNSMITEGICDIAIELINQNSDGKFNKEAYIKGKLVSYGMSLLTMGINAALQCPKIMNAAKRACRWISQTLRKSSYFVTACEYVATKFDKLGNFFEKMETLAKFSQLSKADKLKFVEELEKSNQAMQLNYLDLKEINLLKEQQRAGILTELSHYDKCVSTFKQVGISVMTGVARRTVEHVVMTKVVIPKLSSAVSDLKPMIKKHVAKCVKKHIDEKKLRCNSYGDIQKVIKEIKDSIDYETVRDIFQDAILNMSKHCSDWRVQLGALAIDQFVSWKKVYNYARSLCEKINDKLQITNKSINNRIDQLVDKLIDQLTDEMYAQVVSTTAKTCKDVYTVGRSAYVNRKRKKAEEAKCLEYNRDFKEGGVAGQEQARAMSDVIKRPIHIYKNGEEKPLVVGEQYLGEPVKVTYYPPDENNPTGHYVPHGESENWSSANNNNCLCDAVGAQTEEDPNELRARTVQQIESDPTSYIASNVRDAGYGEGTDIFLEGGARRVKNEINSEFYPSHENRIRVANGYKYRKILADTRNLLNKNKVKFDRYDSKNETDKLRFMRPNKHEPKCSSAAGKTDMMMCVIDCELTNGKKTIKYQRVAVSGSSPFNFKGKIGDYTIVDSGKPEGNVYDVYNRKLVPDVSYSKSCSVQKLFFDLGQLMQQEEYKDYKVKGEILVAESWYEPGTATYKAESVKIEASCSYCEGVLPAATGANHEEDWC